ARCHQRRAGTRLGHGRARFRRPRHRAALVATVRGSGRRVTDAVLATDPSRTSTTVARAWRQRGGCSRGLGFRLEPEPAPRLEKTVGWLTSRRAARGIADQTQAAFGLTRATSKL